METFELDDIDQQLLTAASEVLARNYDAGRHSVGAAVYCGSGKIFSAVNIETVGYGPCAEPVAIGSAVSAGERDFQRIVAVSESAELSGIISPCGNCRQLLYEYAPDCLVIVQDESELLKVRMRDLLPFPYKLF